MEQALPRVSERASPRGHNSMANGEGHFWNLSLGGEERVSRSSMFRVSRSLKSRNGTLRVCGSWDFEGMWFILFSSEG
jgi:hypothetical protein